MYEIHLLVHSVLVLEREYKQNIICKETLFIIAVFSEPDQETTKLSWNEVDCEIFKQFTRAWIHTKWFCIQQRFFCLSKVIANGKIKFTLILTLPHRLARTNKRGIFARTLISEKQWNKQNCQYDHESRFKVLFNDCRQNPKLLHFKIAGLA